MFRAGRANIGRGGESRGPRSTLMRTELFVQSRNIGEIARELAAKFKHRDQQDIAAQLRAA